MTKKTNLIYLLIIILFSSCKYPVVLRAKLMDDLSAIDLILYKTMNSKFGHTIHLAQHQKELGNIESKKTRLYF